MGTPDYIAPEVLLKKGYGMECDWLVSTHVFYYSLHLISNHVYTLLLDLYLLGRTFSLTTFSELSLRISCTAVIGII